MFLDVADVAYGGHPRPRQADAKSGRTKKIAAEALLFVLCRISLGVLKITESQGSWRPDWSSSIRDISQRVPLGSNKPTEFSDVRWSIWEHVSISSPPPQIDEFSPGLSIKEVLRRDGSLALGGRNGSGLIQMWSHKISLFVRNGVIEPVSARKRCISNLTFSVDHYFSRCSIPAIAPLWSQSPVIMRSVRIDFPELFKTKWENESSFVGNQSFFGESRLPASYTSQNNCEDGDDKCGKRCNGWVLIDDKARQTFAVDLRARQNGNTVLRGIVVCIILLSAYAILKRS